MPDEANRHRITQGICSDLLRTSPRLRNVSILSTL